MTTVCIAQDHREAVRVALPKREWMEAAVAAIAFILLLPGASLLVSVLHGAA